jgi:hypothetical protein
MLPKTAILISGLFLVALIACGRVSQPPAQTQNAQPAAPPPDAAPPQTQAQPPEPASKPEAGPAQVEPAKPVVTQPARKPASAAQAPASAPAPTETSRPAAATPPAADRAVEPAKQAEIIPEVTPPAPPPPKPLVIASGTRFEVRLVDAIDSSKNKTGETFRATLDRDLEADGKVVAPKGSLVRGRIVTVKQSGRVEGKAAMSIMLTEITIGQTALPIETNTLAFEAESSTKDDAAKIGIGAGVGAIIGAIAGGGKGAAIGAAVGGGAGTATVMATKGKDVKFSVEEKFSFVLRKDLTVNQ